MKRKGNAPVGLIVGLIFLVILGILVYLYNSSLFEREAPQIALDK